MAWGDCCLDGWGSGGTSPWKHTLWSPGLRRRRQPPLSVNRNLAGTAGSQSGQQKGEGGGQASQHGMFLGFVPYWTGQRHLTSSFVWTNSSSPCLSVLHYQPGQARCHGWHSTVDTGPNLSCLIRTGTCATPT